MEITLFMFLLIPGIVGGLLGGFIGANAGVLWNQHKNREFIEKEHELRMQAIEDGKLKLM